MTEDYRDALSITDDEDADFDEEYQIPESSGVLSKWTNYIQGWQDRFIVVKHGTISYYKSEEEASVGCRGTVSMSKAIISAHEFDDCRFDVGINDCLWYLRASNSDERRKWMTVLELHKQAESGFGSENSLRRHGSHLSLTSTTNNSTASASSFKRGRGLREKLAEMETFKDILCRQVDSLQNYFDTCASALANYSVHDFDDDVGDEYNSLKNGHNHNNCTDLNNALNYEHKERDLMSLLRQHGAHAVDFRGESLTFKATTAGTLTTLGHCIELITQREEAWKKRMEREIEKRKKLEDSYRHLLAETMRPVIKCGPDYEEGPHSMLKEEEFFDAIDATLDKLEQEEEQKLQMAGAARCASIQVPKTCLDTEHPLYEEINRVVEEHIKNADMSASDVAGTWTEVMNEGEMKIYKKFEPDAEVYPVKAVHSVKGITAHELCHYFWEPSVRLEWESTLETTQVLDWLSTDTHITYQLLKRVWPTCQRDSVFWSTIRHCPSEDGERPDYWIVANRSTENDQCPPNKKIIRLNFNISMIGQTVINPPPNGQSITRDMLTCRIQYCATVNPGGWVPSNVIQIVCKREAPKFLKRFTSYVMDKTKDSPIMF